MKRSSSIGTNLVLIEIVNINELESLISFDNFPIQK